MPGERTKMMRGRTGRTADELRPERRLVAAVIVQAVIDAAMGDLWALAWLCRDGVHLADDADLVHPDLWTERSWLTEKNWLQDGRRRRRTGALRDSFL